MRSELRSIFQLYGKPGQWERLQAEIANERARIKAQLELEALHKERVQTIIAVISVLIIGIGSLIMWAGWLTGRLG